MSSRPRTSFVCQSCGNRTPKWVGRCGACDEWGTVVEETAATTTADPKADARAAFGALVATAPKRLLDIDGTEVPRRGTGIGELDRVLGGGLVPGSLMLVGGDPGIGKSTLMLQASERLAASGLRVLYVTGEESPHQTRMRFDRIGARAADLWLVAETSLQRIEAHVDQWFASFDDSIKCVIVDIDESFALFAAFKSKRQVNGIPAILCFKKGNLSYIPDFSVNTSDLEAVNIFFKQVRDE
jgi:DNA repair protein RadA/Sms